MGRWSRSRAPAGRGAVRAFKKRGWRPCWAVGRWQGRYAQPWLLLTNWPQAQANWYGLRMWEEAAFRDLKSGGWQWHRSQIRLAPPTPIACGSSSP